MIGSDAELRRVRAECRRLVRRRALAAAAAAALPIPGADLAAEIGLLAQLIPAITRAFGLSEAQLATVGHTTRQRAVALAAGLGNSFIGRAVTKRAIVALLQRVGVRVAAGATAKFVPAIGTAVAAAAGYGALRWLGDAHIEDCVMVVRGLLADETAA